MKINRKTLSLIIASLCGTFASATAVGQERFVASSGRIGDVDSSMVTDGIGYGGATANSVEPSSGLMFRSPEFAMPGTMYSDCNSCSAMSSTCNSGCNTSSMAWFESEALLWWGKGMSGTPTIVGGSTPSAPPSTVLAGGPNTVGGDLRVGYRFSFGKWLDSDQNYGVMGRVFGLFGSDDSTTYTNGGNSTAVRFFDTSPSVNDINNYLVNLTIPGVGVGTGTNTGTITVANELDLIATDISGRIRLLGDGRSRGDLLGGYSFLRLDSAYHLNTSLTDGINNIIQDGTVITTSDVFGTRNVFHGGHVGFLNEVASGRFSLNLLGKVALGNMRSTSSVVGSYSEDPPIGATVTRARGIFAQPINSGSITRDRFTFIPEAGAKLKYQLGRGQFGVGYTMLMLPSVAMAASQIDTNVSSDNFVPFPVDPPRTPMSRFALDSYFLHGIDLGYTLNF